MIYNKEVEIDGKKISIEYGRYAKQSNAAVMVTCGETMVFVVATMAKESREGVDFFPLQVEYREKAFAAGKYPGGFFKREARPSDYEILIRRRGETEYASYCPQLNLMLTGSFHEEVENLMYEKILAHIKKLKEQDSDLNTDPANN